MKARNEDLQQFCKYDTRAWAAAMLLPKLNKSSFIKKHVPANLPKTETLLNLIKYDMSDVYPLIS